MSSHFNPLELSIKCDTLPLFGSAFADNKLIDGAIAPDATRNLAGIQSYMAGLTTLI